MCRNCNFVQQRLNRIVATPDWIMKFPNAKIMHLTRLRSGHCLSLNNDNINRDVRPFRCELMWIDYPDFRNLVHYTWHTASNSHQVATKKFLRKAREWNRSV